MAKRNSQPGSRRRRRSQRQSPGTPPVVPTLAPAPPRPAGPLIDPLGRQGRLAARLGIALALLMTCALFHIHFYRHFAHTKYFALAIATALVVVGAVAGWRRGIPCPESRREMRLFRLAILAVLATWLFSLLFAVNVGHGLENLIRIAPILIVAWWAAQRPLSWRRDVPWMIGVMFLTTVVVLILGLAQWEDFQRVWYNRWVDHRQYGTFEHWRGLFLRERLGLLSHGHWLSTLGNKNSAGSFYAGALSLMAGVVVLDRSLLRRAIALVLAAVLAKVLIWTTSRGGTVAAMAGLGAAGFALLVAAPRRDNSENVAMRAGVALLLLGWVVSIAFRSAGVVRVLFELMTLLGVIWIVWLSHTHPWGRGMRLLAAVGLGLMTLLWAFAALWFAGLAWPLAVLLAVVAGVAVGGLSLNAEGRAPFRRMATVVVVLTVILWIGLLRALSSMDLADLQHQDSRFGAVWEQVVGGGDKSFMDRLYIWQSASRMVRDHPLTGIGFAQFPLIYPRYTLPEYYELWPPSQLITTEEAHSGHLNLTLETGVLGALAWTLLLGLAWRGAMRRMRWAEAGDEAARAALIWFPPAVAMVAHMAVDKFWAYPASLTLMMFSFGQMVRPRMVETLPRSQVELRTLGRVAALAAGALLLAGGIWGVVELFGDTGSRELRVALALAAVAMVWGLIGAAWPRLVFSRPARHETAAVIGAVGLVIAVVALWPSAQLAAGSNALARARLCADQWESYDSRLSTVVNPVERRAHLAERERNHGLALQATRDARILVPWTCDSWSRSLDFLNRTASPVANDPVIVRLLFEAIRVAPNYYPVQRNLATAAATQASALRRASSEDERWRQCLELARRINEQVLELRPTELLTLQSQAEIARALGDAESAMGLYQRFLDYPGIDHWGMGLADNARVQMAILCDERGDLESALEWLEAADRRAVGINQMGLWLRICLVQIRQGRFDEAVEGLRGRIRDLSDTTLARQAQLYGASESNPRDRIAVQLIGLLRRGDVEEALDLIRPRGALAESALNWSLNLVIARLGSEDLCRREIELARQAMPGESFASAEAQLLSP